MNPSSLAVELRDVHVSVPGVPILQGIDWQVPRGQRVAVLGPNGCGKSTLLRALTAYGHVTQGSVDVLGERLGETSVHDLRKRMGIVDLSLVRLVEEDMLAEELVATGLFGHFMTYFDPPTAEQLELARRTMRAIGLQAHCGQLANTLSAGQLRRTWLARALIHQPEMLVLDEPTADLDLLARETLLATLARLADSRPDLTLLLVSHHLEDLLPGTDQVLLLSRGRPVACGPPAQVLTSANVSRAFGCPVEVSQRDGRWHWSVSPRAWEDLLPPA